MPPTQVLAHSGSGAEETLTELSPALSLQRPSQHAFIRSCIHSSPVRCSGPGARTLSQEPTE